MLAFSMKEEENRCLGDCLRADDLVLLAMGGVADGMVVVGVAVSRVDFSLPSICEDVVAVERIAGVSLRSFRTSSSFSSSSSSFSVVVNAAGFSSLPSISSLPLLLSL